jgi:hypothetical protein
VPRHRLSFRPTWSHSVVARLQFSIGKSTQLVTKYATLSISKSTATTARKGSGVKAFGREGLSSWCPKNAQSPGARYAMRTPQKGMERSRAGGLVRLVLRVMDWYTSCSSLNLPSAEYAGESRATKCDRSPSLAGSMFQSISLIDRGQRNGIQKPTPLSQAASPLPPADPSQASG